MLDALQFVGFHFGSLVEQNHVAELNLLDDEVDNVLFVDVFLHEVVAHGKLIFHAQGIHHGHNVV